MVLLNEFKAWPSSSLSPGRTPAEQPLGRALERGGAGGTGKSGGIRGGRSASPTSSLPICSAGSRHRNRADRGRAASRARPCARREGAGRSCRSLNASCRWRAARNAGGTGRGARRTRCRRSPLSAAPERGRWVSGRLGQSQRSARGPPALSPAFISVGIRGAGVGFAAVVPAGRLWGPGLAASRAAGLPAAPDGTRWHVGVLAAVLARRGAAASPRPGRGSLRDFPLRMSAITSLVNPLFPGAENFPQTAPFPPRSLAGLLSTPWVFI